MSYPFVTLRHNWETNSKLAHIGYGGATRSCGAKRFFCHSRKTKNGKKFLFGQQLHVTILQNGTKYG